MSELLNDLDDYSESSALERQYDHGYKHVKSPGELRLGYRYERHRETRETRLIGEVEVLTRQRVHIIENATCMTVPERNAGGEFDDQEIRIRVMHIDPTYVWEIPVYLSDLGLCPRSDGTWEKFIWLTDPKKPKPEKNVALNPSGTEQ